MKLTMLGTGNALVTECFNTCFVMEENRQCFLVDGGGGSAILRQLKHAGYDWMDMRHIFVTHKHVDHLMGVIWMVRMICQFMNHGEYKGEAYIYSHMEVLDLIRDMAGKLLLRKETRFIDDRLHLVEIHDGETRNIIGHDVTFFDIQSTKASQYGFCMDLGDGQKLTCCGDEPYTDCEEAYAKGSKWLLHEAFCLYSQRDIFDPYKSIIPPLETPVSLLKSCRCRICSCIIQRIELLPNGKSCIRRKAHSTIPAISSFRMIWNAWSCKEAAEGVLIKARITICEGENHVARILFICHGSP